MKTFPKGGIHPQDKKLNAEAHSKTLGLPVQAIVFVNQHLGAASSAIVQKGDKLKVGQVLTSNDNFIGSTVHSPFSGTVNKIDMLYDASGYRKEAIVIDVEGDEWLNDIDNSEDFDRAKALSLLASLSPNDIINKVKNAGIVGLGGACFPTQVKLTVPEGKKADFLIINAVECEPYLTDDYRLMMEEAEKCLIGIAALKKALNVDVAFIGIEKNKPQAITLLSNIADKFVGIKVVPLKVKYPQGAEKQLIKAITKREVPSGKLPIDAGSVVCNIGTAFAVYEAICKNKPLIDRIVTVTGNKVSEAINFKCRIGTPLSMLLEAADGMPENTSKVIMGGPMMGKTLFTTDTAVVKGTSALLLVDESESKRGEIANCIRCARCSDACPMALRPYYLSAVAENANYEATAKANIMDCIECGCCQYSCPSNRPLLDTLRMGKYNTRIWMTNNK